MLSLFLLQNCLAKQFDKRKEKRLLNDCKKSFIIMLMQAIIEHFTIDFRFIK